MDSKELLHWLVRSVPVKAVTVGLQPRLFGRGMDEMLMLHGRDREAGRKRVHVVVRRAVLDQAINAVLVAYARQVRRKESTHAKRKRHI